MRWQPWPPPRPARCGGEGNGPTAGGRPAPAPPGLRRRPLARGADRRGAAQRARPDGGRGCRAPAGRSSTRVRSAQSAGAGLADQRHEDRGERRGNPCAGDPELRGDGSRRGGRRARDHERPHVQAALLLALAEHSLRGDEAIRDGHRSEAGVGSGRWPTRRPTRPMWSWSAPGLRGWPRRGDLTARGASVVVVEARDRVGGRVLNDDIGDGKVVEVGGQWIGPTQDRLAALAARAGRGHLPHPRARATTCSSTAAGCAATGARSRASTRSCCSTSSTRSAGSTGWRASVPLDAPWEAPEGREARRADRRHLDAPQPRHAGRPDAARARHRGGLGRPARGHLAAARALLHPLGGQPRAAVRHRGRRPAGPLRGRLAADPDPDGRGARRRSGSCSARPCAASSTARRRDRRTPTARVLRGRARDRRGGAHARGPDRVRPAAARLPRPAHPAHAAGHGGQVHGDLRRAVLARRGPVRPGHERPRPGHAHLRQLAARRLAGRAARLPRGPPRARARPPAAPRSAAPP